MKMKLLSACRPFGAQGLLSFFIILSVATGCFRDQKNTDADANTALPEDGPACFLFVQGRDTIALSLVPGEDDKVGGTLAFRFYEKDKSAGIIDGYLRGDTLFANYRFTAEGTLSFREVAFLRRGDSWVLGSGEILNSGNRDVFKDHRTLNFSGNIILNPAECKMSM